MPSGAWLLPSGADRDRMLELDRQLRPGRAWIRRVLAGSLIVCAPWVGWWAVLPLLSSVAIFKLLDGPMERTRHPEYALFAVWVGSELITAASVALVHGSVMPMAAWLAMPVLTLGARFSGRGIALGVGIAIAVLAAVEIGVDAQALRADPPRLIAPAAVILCVALFQSMVVRSELRLRGELLIDPLTGMLNRRALEQRVDELQQQSALTLRPVGILEGDIDEFKAFNDQYGHAAGDALLADVSERIRTTLRAFDSCYRTGGEEFVVVLPGADLAATARIAEQLRVRVAALASGGRGVTMSFGVAASSAGVPFEFARVFEQADAALYEAKRSGRNRVCPQVALAAAPAAA
jgi:diguanylate cyclase (GGDEF)-like protein